jgi:hypothetical protein
LVRRQPRRCCSRARGRADALATAENVDDVQLALHLVDFVIGNGGPHSGAAKARKADLLAQRANYERSFVASNILTSAAQLQRAELGDH